MAGPCRSGTARMASPGIRCDRFIGISRRSCDSFKFPPDTVEWQRLFRADQPQLGAVLARDSRRLFEVELLDPEAALGDLVGRDAELFEVAARLAEMALEIEHPVLEAAHVFEKAHHLDLDEPRLL